MKKFKDYNETQSYTESAKLPIGGYIVKVQNVRFEEGTNGNSDRLILMVDVNEGEYKDFYKNQYESQTGEDKKWKGTFMIYCPKDDGTEQDQWTKRRFKTIMEHIEASNPGYSWNWDENTLKGKLFGAIVGEIKTVIEGRDISYNAIRFTTTVDNIKKSNFKTPEPYTRGGAAVSAKKEAIGNEGFMSVDGTQEEIPF